MNQNIHRRYLFWDNFNRALADIQREFNSQAANKFIDEHDSISIAGINAFLQSAQILALKRYHSVLGDFITDKESERSGTSCVEN